MELSKDEIVRQEIVAKAQKLFQQYGLKKTTMDEIADACGKAKSTLYYYFKSKDEVFDAVVVLESQSLRNLVKAEVDKEVTVKEKIVRYLLSFHEKITEKINLYRIARQEMKNRDLAREYFSNIIEFEKTFILRILEDAYDAGEIKALSKNELVMIAEVLPVSFFGLVTYSLAKNDVLDREKLSATANLVVGKMLQ